MISEARRKSGGSPSLKGMTGSGMENPTYIGMKKSGLLHQATMRKLNKLTPDCNLGEESKTKHDDTRMSCTTSTDQSWVGMLETASRTLHRKGLKRAPA
jgi:hypothetical protein